MVCPSVCPSVRLSVLAITRERLDRLTWGLELKLSRSRRRSSSEMGRIRWPWRGVVREGVMGVTLTSIGKWGIKLLVLMRRSWKHGLFWPMTFDDPTVGGQWSSRYKYVCGVTLGATLVVMTSFDLSQQLKLSLWASLTVYYQCWKVSLNKRH